MSYDEPEGNAVKEIFKTEDSGETWTKISVVIWEGISNFSDEGHAWAVARSDDQAALVVSQDRGQYWSILESKLVP